jgi:hypothetical protein
MDYFVSVQDAAGVGYGEIHTVYSWNASSPLDQAGTFTFDMPAADPHAALLIPKRIVICYVYLNGVLIEAGSGIIDSVTLALDASGNPTGDLTISGPDRLRELCYRHVGPLLISDAGYTGPADIIAYAPTGWALDAVAPAYIATLKQVSYQFANESVLDAFYKLAEITGEHFRSGGVQEIEWIHDATIASGVRAFYGMDPLAGDSVSTNCLITNIQVLSDSSDSYIGRLYAQGAGVGPAAITLDGAVLPAGYIAAGYALGSDAKGFYLEHTATWASYGIEAKRTWNDQAEAQSLSEMAYEMIRRSLTVTRSYSLSVSGLTTALLPGQSIRVIAHQWVDGYHAINIDADLVILSVHNRLDGEGMRTVGLTCSTIDRPILDDTGAVVSAISDIQDASAHPQFISGSDVVGTPGSLTGLAVSITAGKTLTLAATNDFTLTVPATGTSAIGAGTLTSSTTNDVTGAAHTHAITPGLGLLSNADAQYKILVSGATPFAPVYSGFKIDGTTGSKTSLAVTSGKTLTLTAADDFNLTIPATGTAALLATANVFTALNTFNVQYESKLMSWGAYVSYEVGYTWYDGTSGQFRLYGSPYGALGLYSQANKDIVLVPGTGKVSITVTDTAANASHQISETVAILTQTSTGNFNNYGLIADMGFSLNTGIANTESQIGFIGGVNVLGTHLGTQGLIVGLQPTNTLINGAGGIVTSAFGIRSFAITYQGTVTTALTNAYGVKIETPTVGGGSLTNDYGLYIENQNTGGTLNFAIVTNAGNVVFNEGGDASSDLRAESDTEANMLFLDANGDTDGALYLGGSTNGIKINKGGELTLLGTATVFQDLSLAAHSLRAGATPPTWTAWNGTLYAPEFINAATTDLHGSFELLHDYKQGSDLDFHIHWSPSTTNAGNCKWGLDFSIVNIDGTFAAPTTITITPAASGTVLKHSLTSFGTISGAGLTIGAVIDFRIYRLGSDAADTFTGSAFLHNCGMHYEVDTMGSKTATAK